MAKAGSVPCEPSPQPFLHHNSNSLLPAVHWSHTGILTAPKSEGCCQHCVSRVSQSTLVLAQGTNEALFVSGVLAVLNWFCFLVEIWKYWCHLQGQALPPLSQFLELALKPPPPPAASVGHGFRFSTQTSWRCLFRIRM